VVFYRLERRLSQLFQVKLPWFFLYVENFQISFLRQFFS